MRPALSRFRRRTRTDPIPTRARLGADHRTLPRLQAEDQRRRERPHRYRANELDGRRPTRTDLRPSVHSPSGDDPLEGIDDFSEGVSQLDTELSANFPLGLSPPALGASFSCRPCDSHVRLPATSGRKCRISAAQITPKPTRGATSATSIAVVNPPRTISDRRLARRRVRTETCVASAWANTWRSKTL